jgi:hypothetical protein
MSPLLFPEHARERFARWYRKRHREWISGGGEWPLAVTLGNPTETQAQQHPDLVRSWIAAWQAWTGAGQIAWAERRWRTLGHQRLPDRLILSTPHEVAAWVGETDRWIKAQQRYTRLAIRWPAAAACLARYFDALADYPEIDIEQLERVTSWLDEHPRSQLYPRQLPIPGLHTKWLERQTTLIGDLLRALRGGESVGMDFYELCGLRQPPALMRLRVLDPALRAQVGGLGDVSTPIEDLARAPLRPGRVYIVENLQTGLAFPELPDAVVLMRMGYAVEALSEIPWLKGAECVYWGDIDTHGFAILSRVRARLPDVRSMLMDEDTLLNHRMFWGREEQQHSATELPHLLHTELAVYRALKTQHWGFNVRLEQEQIGWNVVEKILHMGCATNLSI